ncbi:hypothetical protein U8527_08635 [Kordia algicida OT-1]|uniref:Uncharacterized protein n=1 Tax=Kordia algicida OT-1 TaxID=391587 RepID=A9E6T0_9FLAO|nr:hypothetical protein [Kordia algicida]EDP95081.1 hypothetical protein KAOT1_02059 [Kordia algicida OT-1]
MKITERENNRLYEIFKGIALCFIIVMSLFHSFFPNTTPELERNYKFYKTLLAERDSVENLLITQLENKKISNSEFRNKFYSNKTYYKKEIKNCNNEKRKIAHAFSFNGRRSLHYWLFVFGLSFSFFILSIRYTYKQLLYLKKSNKLLKKAQILESSAWISISIFWVIHSIFVRGSDLPTPVYASILFSICLLIGYSVFYLIKYFVENKLNKITKLKRSISRLVTLISDIRINHYFLMAAKAQSTHGKDEIEKDVEILEEKIFSTIEKVADES